MRPRAASHSSAVVTVVGIEVVYYACSLRSEAQVLVIATVFLFLSILIATLAGEVYLT